MSNRHVLAGRVPETNDWVDSQGLPTHVEMTTFLMNEPGVLTPRIDSFRLLTDDLDPLWVEHPEYGALADVVALPLPEGFDPAIAVPFTSPAFRIAAPDPVMVVGYPLGLNGGAPGYGVWVQGTIASRYEIDHGGLPRFMIDSRTRSGLSGSPVFFYPNGRSVRLQDGSSTSADRRSFRLLGVYSGRVDPEADLGWVWRAEFIEALVNRGAPGNTVKPTVDLT